MDKSITKRVYLEGSLLNNVRIRYLSYSLLVDDLSVIPDRDRYFFLFVATFRLVVQQKVRALHIAAEGILCRVSQSC
jgi:hypothetical protein